MKQTQTHINRKKYANGSVNSEEHLYKLKPGATLIQAYIFPLTSSKAQKLVRQSL
jgi:hypothetical protein